MKICADISDTKILTDRLLTSLSCVIFLYFALIIHNHTSLIIYILEYFTQKFAEHNRAPHHVLICCTALTEEKTWFYLLQLLSFKHVEKLEIHVQELTIKIEELNRTIVDITSHKTRLSQVCKCQVL